MTDKHIKSAKEIASAFNALPLEQKRRSYYSNFVGNRDIIWSNNSQVLSALGGRDQGFGRGAQREERAAEKIQKAKTAKDLRNISIDHQLDQGYSDVINYYKTMYHYRYLVIPVTLDRTKASDSLLPVSEEMLKIVNSLNFEAILPNILEIGLYEGRATIYIEKRKNGAVTYILPNEYTEPLLSSNYGTETVLFDLTYFDELLNSILQNKDRDVLNNKKSKEEEKKREKADAEMTMAILSYFPKELQKAYLEYAGLDVSGMKIKGAVKSKNSLITLSDSNAAIIPFSRTSAPPKIDVAAAEQNYKEIKEIQGTKQRAGLDKIFTHQIPLDKDGIPILSVNEVREIQQSMEGSLGDNANVKVISTFGQTNLFDIQKAKAERDTSVSDAYDSKFEAASINPQLFRADTDYALGVSLKRDAAFIWDILSRIMNFYNNSINEIFNFGNYSCLIKLLPITTYNEEDKVNEYRRGAEYGIGKLEAVVATGQSQISLIDKLQLEKEMNLDELLTPLQSSHTRSAKDQGKEQEVKVEVEDSSKEKEIEEKAEEVNDEQKED